MSSRWSRVFRFASFLALGCACACATGVVDETTTESTADAAAPDASSDVTSAVESDDASSEDASADADAGAEAEAEAEADADADADAGIDASHDAALDATKDATADAGCGTGTVVINEVQTGGSGGAEDEWVEIRNPLGCALDLTGYALKHAAIDGTTIQTAWIAPAHTSIPARGYGVVAGLAYSGSATPIGTFAAGVLAATGGGLGLYDANGARVDAVGFGAGATNPFVEKAPAAAPGASQSIARTPDGKDDDDNGADFALATTPTPGAKNP